MVKVSCSGVREDLGYIDNEVDYSNQKAQTKVCTLNYLTLP